jgi:hypothetical protein
MCQPNKYIKSYVFQWSSTQYKTFQKKTQLKINYVFYLAYTLN